MNLKNTDLIVVGSADCDYPIFREFLHKNFTEFNKVHYIISTPLENDHAVGEIHLEDFLKSDLSFANVSRIETIDNDNWHDWRSVSVNQALKSSTSEYILFIEPDFEMDIDVMKNIPQHDVVGFKSPGTQRTWPSFLYVKRDLIEKTSKMFSAVSLEIDTEKWENFTKSNGENIKNNYDHFDLFNEELEETTDDIFYLDEEKIEFVHYTGVSFNFSLCGRGQFDIVPLLSDRKRSFITFLSKSINAEVQQNEDWLKLMKTSYEYFIKNTNYLKSTDKDYY